MAFRLYIVVKMNAVEPIPPIGEIVQISSDEPGLWWFPDTVPVRDLENAGDDHDGVSWVCSVDFKHGYELATNLNRSRPIFAKFIFSRGTEAN